MLETLRIRNFRGFRNIEVGPLSRINIFAGLNNSGKSALLEAVFLLVGAGAPELALNAHIVRMRPGTAPKPVWQTLWLPLFFDLDTRAAITLSGSSSSNEEMSLTIELKQSARTTAPRTVDGGVLTKERSGDRALKFTYVDPSTGPIESEARETTENVVFDRKEAHAAFHCDIIQPGRGDLKTDAIELGKLRKQKRGDLILSPLRLVDPRIQTIEDNASSGTPTILVDIGLPELVPLSMMGGGMTHLVRILLATAFREDGVVLIDEIENGLHHSILPKVWGVIAETAERFNVQVFATTHSLECVEAAHNALGAEGFRLHRLEVDKEQNRCVTLSPTALGGAIRHNLEIR